MAEHEFTILLEQEKEGEKPADKKVADKKGDSPKKEQPPKK